MDGHRSIHHGLIAAVVLAVALLLAACGADNPSGTTVTTVTGVVAGATTVGLNTCTSCHTVQTAAWLATKHANMEPAGDLNSTGKPTSAQIASGNCATCHDPLGDSGRLTAGYTGATRPVVGCESCHGGGSLHEGGGGPIGSAALPAAVIGTASTVQASAQFRTCTVCHELLDANNPAGAASATAAHDVGGGNLPTSAADSVTDTHFAKYMTSFGTNSLSGYAMDYNSSTVCVDCHDPHGVTTINQEWQKSAHADIYGTDTGYNRGAWARANWSCNGTSTLSGCLTQGNIADRGFCQRCHTTEGFIAFADALRAGNTARANEIRQGDLHFVFTAGTYSPLASVVTYTTAGWKPQMLKCNACHTDYKGTLRNPGPFPGNYDLWSVTKRTTGPAVSVFATGVDRQYPDALGSNICVACHSGRENGETIKALNTDPTLSIVDFSNRSLITSHELTGGGTVYTASGYEFYGRSYDNNSGYRHENIGTTKEPGTGSNGPCVGCHMSRPKKNGNHIFLPITRAYIDPAGPFVSKASATITGIASEVCFNCHGPNDTVILDLVREQKALYEEAVEAVAHVSGVSGYYFRDGISPQRDGTLLRSGLGASATNGSPVVTSVTSTNWNALNITGTSQFRIDSNGTFYTIASVDTGSQITLAAPYAGPTVTNAKYTVLKAETVSVTYGSPTVTGASTLWSATTVTGGDYFRVDSDGAWYRIKQVNSDTSITLGSSTATTPYAGPTAAGEAYTIIKSARVTNWLTQAGPAPFTVPDTDTTGEVSGKNNMGAAFNIYLFEADPAGYVHNRYYMKRLMYDTIDWLDDNQMNYSTGATLNSTCTAAVPAPPAWCTGAMEYILPNGVIPNVAAERP